MRFPSAMIRIIGETVTTNSVMLLRIVCSYRLKRGGRQLQSRSMLHHLTPPATGRRDVPAEALSGIAAAIYRETPVSTEPIACGVVCAFIPVDGERRLASCGRSYSSVDRPFTDPAYAQRTVINQGPRSLQTLDMPIYLDYRCSIRIGRRWRICLRFENGRAFGAAP